MKNKGISLIVLVITIIVIIILATAVIVTLMQNNPIEQAKEASFKASVGEYISEVGMYISDIYAKSIGAYNVKDLTADTDESVKAIITNIKKEHLGKLEIQYGEVVYIKDKVSSDEEKWLIDLGVKEKDTKVNIESSWDKPYIPSGFEVSKVPGESEVSTGLVIVDKTNGNEFVWVPVKDFSDLISNDFSGEDQTKPELAKIYKSIETRGGFYIARYEAGLQDLAAPQTSNHNTVADGSIKPVSKRGVSPWNFVAWGENDDVENPGNGAITLSRSMYNKLDIATNLMYEIQWKATLDFMKTVDYEYLDNADGKGNFLGALAVTGSNTAYKVGNIYDMAGNVIELTMSRYYFNARNKVVVGGMYDMYPYHRKADFVSNTKYSYSYYEDDSNGYKDSLGFRVTMYIK